MSRTGAASADEPGKRATVKEVAARAGVSTATVSRVMGGTYPVAEATRRRVQQAAQDLDYVLNASARGLRSTTSNTVAFVVADVKGPFFSLIADGVEQQATAEGRLCLVCTTHNDPDRELAVINLLREQRAEAIILVGGAVETPEYTERMVKLAHSLDTEGSRLVLCGRPSLGPDVPETVVEYDNEGGAFAMTSYLLSMGHERIALVGVGEHSTAAQRVRGYRRALQERGLPLAPELVIQGDHRREDGYQATRELLRRKEKFTAVFAVTDIIAAGAMKALREAGVRVPEDVSLVGYDDIPLSQDLTPELTTVHVPHEELGRASVRLALNRKHNPAQHVKLGTHVVVRQSAGAAASRQHDGAHSAAQEHIPQ
ncbi:LacI family DNA-binding transcriptional regulator [Streptomyces sp. GbtcB7]|uniref:LacI family DNA-binding transcriptional regulator n=1 Tax=Streptomyces sp. GbtcB7 TaxID=2824752 RepID=UPI001C310BB3|nr:LacI family DNA-binding transcriptional regulator [Streptomyces sp. GbtcB7]